MKTATTIAAFSVLAIVRTAPADTIYENDFATRTSDAHVPSQNWRSVDYVTGLLANTNPAAPLAATDGVNLTQDGWMKSQQATNLGNARIHPDGGNPMAVLGHVGAGEGPTDNQKFCFVKQRLGETFTAGTVTVQFDFLPPGYWASYGSATDLRRAALSIGDENFVSPVVAQSRMYEHTVGSVGVALSGARKVYYNAAQTTANTATTYKEVTRYAWHRAVVTIDLDSRRWGFSMFELGTSHPALDAATPASAVYSAADLPFADESVAGVSSIGLSGYGVCWSGEAYSASTDPAYAACFDNIRVWHNGTECYENDFSSSRRRSLGGTLSHTYVADCLVTNRVGSEVYVPGQKVIGSFTGANVVQPMGVDGWRRTAHTAGISNAYVSATADYTVLRCDGGAKTDGVVYLAHPFGSTVSSGKVLVKADVRLHSTWTYNSSYLNTVWLTLGDEAYYNSTPSAANNHRFTSVGIRATSASRSSPLYMPPSGTQTGAIADGAIVKSHWYRLELSADIDNGKVLYKIYDQGETPPNSATADGSLLYTSPEFDRLNPSAVQSISCFSLGTYFTTAYFDNIKVWSIPTGGSATNLLYENYFTSRTIYARDTRVAPLVGTMRLSPEGQDGWKRPNLTEKGIFVDWADGNPALTFERDGYESFAVQDIGQNVRTGVMTAQADIRPPKGWLAQNAYTYVRLGGDGHMATRSLDPADDSYFLNNIAAGFGFKNVKAVKSGNLWTDSTIVAYRGDRAGGGAMKAPAAPVDPAPGYRFVATADMAGSQYDLSVYDMGATHPTLASATPDTPVATFSGLPFRRAKHDLGGGSCLSVSAHKPPQSVLDTSLQPMIDNIRVSSKELAFVLVVR